MKSESLVDISPSTDIILNEPSAASNSAFSSIALDIDTSVVTNPSIVACLPDLFISGCIIPTPLAAPPIVTTSPPSLTLTAISFLTVSVVIIAPARSLPPFIDSPNMSSGVFDAIFFRGSLWPIIPVEATNTSRALSAMPLAIHAAIKSASASPCLPLAQFALPLLTTMARCVLFLKFAMLSLTGDALKAFVVNTPAAAAGASEYRSARSGFPDFFMPALIPFARKPFGAVTPPFTIIIGGLRSLGIRTLYSYSAPPAPPRPSSGCRYRRLL